MGRNLDRFSIHNYIHKYSFEFNFNLIFLGPVSLPFRHCCISSPFKVKFKRACVLSRYGRVVVGNISLPVHALSLSLSLSLCVAVATPYIAA